MVAIHQKDEETSIFIAELITRLKQYREPVLIYATDEGRILYANAKARTIIRDDLPTGALVAINSDYSKDSQHIRIIDAFEYISNAHITYIPQEAEDEYVTLPGEYIRIKMHDEKQGEIVIVGAHTGEQQNALLFSMVYAIADMFVSGVNNQAAAIFQMVLDALPFMVYLKDPSGKYIKCNRAFAILLGVKKAEVLGRYDYEFDASAEYKRILIEENKSILSRNKSLAKRYMLKYGVWTNVYKEPLRKIGEAKAVGITGILEDISNQRLYEHKELFKQMKERTFLNDLISETDMLAFIAETDEELTITYTSPNADKFAMQEMGPDGAKKGLLAYVRNEDQKALLASIHSARGNEIKTTSFCVINGIKQSMNVACRFRIIQDNRQNSSYLEGYIKKLL